MSDTDEVQILRVKVEKLECELQVSTDALQLARQQLQLQDKLIEDVDKLRKEVELANKRLEERDVQLQCLLQQLALTQTKCNELEEERKNTINMDIPQKDAISVGEIGVETCQEENEKLKEALKEAQEKMGTTNAKQKTMRKEIDELTKELYDYRNENKLKRHYGCDKSTQTHYLSDYSNGNTVKEIEEKVYDFSEEQFPDWGIEKQSLSIADSIKGVAEQMVQELNLEKEQCLNGENAEFQVGTDCSSQEPDPASGESNASHAPDSSFVFDPSSGMYYDSQSGYYYDTSSTLYYDPRTGTYFYYNHSTKEYEFHSKVDLSEYNSETAVADSASDSSASAMVSDEESQAESSELEDGEIKEDKTSKTKSQKDQTKCQTVSNGSYIDSCEDDPNYSQRFSGYPILYRSDHIDAESSDVTYDADYQACMELYAQINQQKDNATRSFTGPVYQQRKDSSELWPPCIRLIVTESNCLNIGKLFVVTCTGASIGQRKKDLIQINDIGKVGLLAKISFDEKRQCYTVKGYCKHTAPCVNDRKVFQGYKPASLAHEDCLTVGETKLSVHIHVGYDTCDGCEPGLVQAKYATGSKQTDCKATSHEVTKREKHRKVLMGIKKKYGLKDSAYVDNQEALKNPNYVDKALNRRKTVGSDNPYIKTQTEQTSVHEEISTENKGRKMLEKLGWSSGQSLGKTNCGIVEPIAPSIRLDPSAGLGSFSSSTTTAVSQKEKNWLNAKVRFNKIDNEDVSDVKPSKRHKMWIKGHTLHPS